MLKKVFGSAVFGVDAITISFEVNVYSGIGYHFVGLPDNAIKESNYSIAAADLRKEGSAYNLTLAVGILAASKQIQAEAIEDNLIMRELSLVGSLQTIKGTLLKLLRLDEGSKGFILSKQNV